ncbi:unnamed protein product [Mytilus coruscus]|uniref:Reverse transcriptase/retrotransposon-derived protein RNase H-like domain-containing protein n=1 Tax=Mytilus coruscus TaxID=42192 RepID=A0A6J8C622_MYTCO|nr:unnamed protein product [Mytilus coruscus]
MEQIKASRNTKFGRNLAEKQKNGFNHSNSILPQQESRKSQGEGTRATFLHVAGSELQRVYNTFDIVADDKEKIDVLKDKFKGYCEPRKNLTYIRHVFFTRNQGPHENIDSYVTDLKNKAKPCEFEHLSDGLIRDRIVCGIQNEGCRARLLREADLTLAKAIDTCRAQEISSQQLKSLKSTEEHSVNAVKQVSKPRYRQNDSHKNQRSVHGERQILCKIVVEHMVNGIAQRSELKQLVSSAPVLRFYNNNEPVRISVDASSKGLGVVLLQKKQPLAYGSRALTETQSRYAQIECEMSAILYNCEKFDHYIYGRRAVIETHHKPLVAIYDQNRFYRAPRFTMHVNETTTYDLRIVYPRKLMFISHAASRAYLLDSNDKLIDDELDISYIEKQLPISSRKLAEIKDMTVADENLSKLSSVHVSGWPNSKEMLPDDIQSYWNFRDEITVIDRLLYKSQCIFILRSLQREILLPKYPEIALLPSLSSVSQFQHLCPCLPDMVFRQRL